MTEKTNWIAHVKWLTLLVTLIGGFYLLENKITIQSQRTDRLYEIYCEMRKDMDQKFYDILKANKSTLP